MVEEYARVLLPSCCCPLAFSVATGPSGIRDTACLEADTPFTRHPGKPRVMLSWRVSRETTLDMPTVTVIIPTHNDGAFIEGALESVLNQTFRDFEIVVVNDGSTDDTEQRLAKFRDKVNYRYQDCRGPSASRNWAIRAARSPLVAFLDADDLWFPTKLEKQVRFALDNPQYGIVTTDVEWFNEQGVTNPSLKSKYPIANGFVLKELLFDNWITTSAVMVRRECFGRAGWFDEEPGVFGEDWMMWVQIAAQYPVQFLDEVLTRRRVRHTSFEQRNAEAQFENLFRNLEKLQNSVPELASRPDLFREAAYRICMGRGMCDLQELNTLAARKKIKRALGYYHLRPQSWILFGASFLPADLLRVIKRTRSRVK
jgi:glycosyl transferase family 2